MAKFVSSAHEKQPRTKRSNTAAAEAQGIDFSKGVRGKYYEDAKASLRVVILDADLQDSFPDSAAVNAALRSLRDLAKRATAAPRRSKRAA